jgi:hypothetical protein
VPSDLSPDLQGAGQTVEGDVVEIDDPRTLEPGPVDSDAKRYLAPEPFIESDAPEIRAEAQMAVGSIEGRRAQAERPILRPGTRLRIGSFNV